MANEMIVERNNKFYQKDKIDAFIDNTGSYSRVPHVLIELICEKSLLKGQEFSLFFYLYRRTIGWRTNYVDYNVSEFSRDLNITRKWLKVLLGRLQTKGLVQILHDDRGQMVVLDVLLLQAKIDDYLASSDAEIEDYINEQDYEEYLQQQEE